MSKKRPRAASKRKRAVKGKATPGPRGKYLGHYGWAPDVPDHRDFVLAAAPVTALPPSVDLRPSCPPVYDQGQLGSCYKDAPLGKAVTYRRVVQTLDQMRACLAGGLPIILGISVYESFESQQVARSGVVPMPAQSEKLLGGHAILAVGYHDAEQRFIMRNSWGTSWGMHGYFTIPYAYLTDSNLCDDLWTIQMVA